MNYLIFLKTFQEKYAGIQDKNLLFNFLREELQYLILMILFRKTTFPVYFMGGTQLRLSYKINRFSEDIDLALDAPDPDFPADSLFQQITAPFDEKISGFKMSSKYNSKRNVIKIMLSFKQILNDLNFSPLADETIKIKIELDINPPKFARYDQKNYHSIFGDYRINTYDLSTSFAGKLSTVLLREYQKGRDYYDLQWYLQQKPSIPVNFPYLNSNLKQQNLPGFKNMKEALEAVMNKIKQLDLNLLYKDLSRFIVMDEKSFESWLDSYIPDTVGLLTDYQQKS